MTTRIWIDNPAPGGARRTSRRAAERYVAKGRARFVRPDRIRFLGTDHRNQSAYRLSVCATDRGYDGRGCLVLAEIRRIPCLKPVELLTIQRKMRIDSPQRNGNVKILVRDGAPVEA